MATSSQQTELQRERGRVTRRQFPEIVTAQLGTWLGAVVSLSPPLQRRQSLGGCGPWAVARGCGRTEWPPMTMNAARNNNIDTLDC